MSPDSLSVLRRIRDRMDRSLWTYPEFRVRFAFGLRTSFARGDDFTTDHREPIQAGPHLWTWETIGDHLGIRNLVAGLHSRIDDYRHSEVQSECPADGIPCRSSFINGLYASAGREVALAAYLDELNALDRWAIWEADRLPIFGSNGAEGLSLGWHGLVCLMKLAAPSRFSFDLRHDHEPDARPDWNWWSRNPGISSLDDFWRLACLQSARPPAFYLMLPSMDARTCSVEVIDAILAQCDGADAAGVANRPMQEDTGPNSNRESEAVPQPPPAMIEHPETIIPDEFRSRPMGVAEAGRKFGFEGKDHEVRRKFRRAMASGEIGFIKLTSQSYIFDHRKFLNEPSQKRR